MLTVLTHQGRCLRLIWNFFFIVDNGTREGLDKFLKAASSDPETVMHYEFMQDYEVSNYESIYFLRLTTFVCISLQYLQNQSYEKSSLSSIMCNLLFHNGNKSLGELKHFASSLVELPGFLVKEIPRHMALVEFVEDDLLE